LKITMEKSIGERLHDERKRQRLSIEDVAHATRIHANTVLGLEADDYSGFASTTYAKSFLKKYASHLGVDASDALAQFSSDATSPIVGGANYIRSVADAIEPVERISGLSDSGHFAHVGSEPGNRSRRNNGGRGGHPVVLGMFLMVLLAAITVLIIIGKDAETPDEALQNLKKLTGGDDSGEADTKSSISAGEVDARPGMRVSPAAPMTRPAKPEKPTPVAIDDPQEPFPGPPIKPLAQANVQKPAIPVAKPIRATPILVTPVVLPVEGEEKVDEGDEPDHSDANSEAGSQTEDDSDIE
jgi:cytoskeletal protein RodZ